VPRGYPRSGPLTRERAIALANLAGATRRARRDIRRADRLAERAAAMLVEAATLRERAERDLADHRARLVP
jgi:hypothetical protein